MTQIVYQPIPGLPAEGLVKLPSVTTATALSRSTLYQLVKSGKFPAPVKLGPRAVAWRVAAVRAWIAERSEEGDAR